MKESNSISKKERKEPVFLIEMPHALRHLVMKRGQMLRSGRTRTLFCLGKGGPKSWLEAKLTPNSGESGEEDWDKAHELADKFKRELHSDVYVEPAHTAGRYRATIVSASVEPSFDPLSSNNGGLSRHLINPSLGCNPLSHFDAYYARNGVGFAAAIFNVDSAFGGPVKKPFWAYSVPDPMADLNRTLAPLANRKLRAREIRCSALYDLSGWIDLSDSKKLMFETESHQLIKSELMRGFGDNLPVALIGSSVVSMLVLQPEISRPLKQFLGHALEKNEME